MSSHVYEAMWMCLLWLVGGLAVAVVAWAVPVAVHRITGRNPRRRLEPLVRDENDRDHSEPGEECLDVR